MPSTTHNKRIRIGAFLPDEKLKKNKVKIGKKRAAPSLPRDILETKFKFEEASKQTVQDGLSPNSTLSIRIDNGTGLEEPTSNPVFPQQRARESNFDVENRTRLEESKWIQFGPMYADQSEVNQRPKDSAWEHILRKDSTIENNYLFSIRTIEEEAMDCYEPSIAEKQRRAPDNFRWMMVKDGCFFLQLTLHILGGGTALGYSAQHLYFGEKSDSSSWIPAMFYVGNQIPFVVIHALMKQQFFQDVIDKTGTWERPSDDDLEKLVLYQTVVEPQLIIRNLVSPQSNTLHALKDSLREFYRISRRKSNRITVTEPPSNILHALHNLLVGSGNPISSEMRHFQDLESTGVNNKKTKIPSAGELYKKGIKLRKAKRSGISNVKFTDWGYSAFLYLPPLTIDAHTKDMLTSLVKFEQGVSGSDREITSYIRFMRDLAPTYKDFKILEEKGIIQVKDKDLKSTVVRTLDNIVSLHKPSFTLNFLQIRHRIEDYGGPPWRLISIMLGILAVIQTIFTILAYFIPRS